MSLSRPVKFPLLKLPFLCIECVTKNSDVFDIIFFALTSRKARRIVKSFKIPLNGIQIFLSERSRILMCGLSKTWDFSKPSLRSFDQNSKKTPLMLSNNPIPLYISRTNDALTSCTYGNAIYALKMAMEFLNEVLKCSVENVVIEDDSFPLSGNIGIKSTVNLCINGKNSQPFCYAQSQKLKLLLENLEVTGTCTFELNGTEKGFYCDPKLFKCREMVFGKRAAAWVTREILTQFDVPRLNFYDCPFSGEDVLSFVTQWFHSDNNNLEYLFIYIQNPQFSLENFQTEEFNAVPFSGRHRVPSTDTVGYIDFSKGLEIVRQDDLQATIHVTGRDFLFYIWHSQ